MLDQRCIRFANIKPASAMRLVLYSDVLDFFRNKNIQ